MLAFKVLNPPTTATFTVFPIILIIKANHIVYKRELNFSENDLHSFFVNSLVNYVWSTVNYQQRKKN
jgi:hypothetical protein